MDLGSMASFSDRVLAVRAQLSPAERRVAEYMLENPERTAAWSATELAEAVRTSDATVVRTARSLGYSGLRELKRMVAAHTERRRDPSLVLSERIAQLPTAGALPLARILGDTGALLGRVEATVRPEAWQLALDLVGQARHVYAYGIGTAGCVADFLQISLTRIGVSATSITHTGHRLADSLLPIEASDTVVIFAIMRQFNETEAIVRHAQRKGAKVVLVSEGLSLALGAHVDALLQAPVSIERTGSGVVVALAIAHALQLAVAAQRPDRAVHTMQEMNSLRTQIVGHDLDSDPATGPWSATEPRSPL